MRDPLDSIIYVSSLDIYKYLQHLEESICGFKNESVYSKELKKKLIKLRKVKVKLDEC
jgi:hypothetical protein